MKFWGWRTRLVKMTKITDMTVVDWRFPTSLHSDGSDAVHKDPDYSCVYVTLHTDAADGLKGYGFRVKYTDDYSCLLLLLLL